MKFKLTRVSGNQKTGPMPVVMCPEDTCWSECPFWTCCYRRAWPINTHQRALNDGSKGSPFAVVCDEIKTLPFGVVWRFGDVGDLPGRNGSIDRRQAMQLVAANRRKRGYCYTHKPVLGLSRQATRNRETIAEMIDGGFKVNLSGEGLAKADALCDLDLAPVATAVPSTLPADWRTLYTPAGRRVLRCPAEYLQGVQCAVGCGGSKGPYCTWRERRFVVGLTAHGATRKINAAIAQQELLWRGE